jgi:hypothetical protein
MTTRVEPIGKGVSAEDIEYTLFRMNGDLDAL